MKKNVLVLSIALAALFMLSFVFNKKDANDNVNTEAVKVEVEKTETSDDVKKDEMIEEEKLNEETNAEEASEKIEEIKAPDFKLESLSGEEISLSDLKGKPVFINFWATWCKYCKQEMPDLQKFKSEYGEDITVITINVNESKEEVENYINENEFDFEVLLDKDGSVFASYMGRGLPASHFVDSNGIYLGSWPGLMEYPDMERVYEGLMQREEEIKK